MNKILTTLLLAAILFACKPKSEEIKPAVETACKKLSYTIINTKTNQLINKDTYIYDKTGKLIEIQGLSSYLKYEYDAKDNLLKISSYLKNQGSETKTSETIYTYNSANQLIRQVTNKITETGASQKRKEYLYEYHANGKMKKWTWFDFTMVFDKPYIIVEYDENGNEILAQFDDGSSEKSEYNAANLLIKITYYNPANSPTGEIRYEYNSRNKKVKTSSYYNGVLVGYINTEYNSKDQQISEIYYDDAGKVTQKIITEYTGESYKTSTYDAQNTLTGYFTIEIQNGLRMKESAYNKDKLVYSIVYAYDTHKNMIKQEEFNDHLITPLRQEWTYQCD
ncbi:hypothetical protein [Emticicia fontis]